MSHRYVHIECTPRPQLARRTSVAEVREPTEVRAALDRLGEQLTVKSRDAVG